MGTDDNGDPSLEPDAEQLLEYQLSMLADLDDTANKMVRMHVAAIGVIATVAGTGAVEVGRAADTVMAGGDGLWSKVALVALGLAALCFGYVGWTFNRTGPLSAWGRRHFDHEVLHPIPPIHTAVAITDEAVCGSPVHDNPEEDPRGDGGAETSGEPAYLHTLGEVSAPAAGAIERNENLMRATERGIGRMMTAFYGAVVFLGIWAAIHVTML